MYMWKEKLQIEGLDAFKAFQHNEVPKYTKKEINFYPVSTDVILNTVLDRMPLHIFIYCYSE